MYSKVLTARRPAAGRQGDLDRLLPRIDSRRRDDRAAGRVRAEPHGGPAQARTSQQQGLVDECGAGDPVDGRRCCCRAGADVHALGAAVPIGRCECRAASGAEIRQQEEHGDEMHGHDLRAQQNGGGCSGALGTLAECQAGVSPRLSGRPRAELTRAATM